MRRTCYFGCTVLFFLVAPGAAQERCTPPTILTNAQLERKPVCRPKPDPAMLESLRAHQFNEPPSLTVEEKYGGYTPRRSASEPVAHSPWDWPTPRPERRLDGTLLSDPITVYGAVPYTPYYPPYPQQQRRRSHKR